MRCLKKMINELKRLKSLEEIVENEKPISGKNHPAYKIEVPKTYDLSKYKLPELYTDGRVIGNEKYIQVKPRNE